MISPDANDARGQAATATFAGDHLDAPFGLVVDGRSTARVPGELHVVSAATTTPVLGWKITPECAARGVSGFEVELSDSFGQPLWGSGTINSTVTEITVGHELSPHSSYGWGVRVTDGDGRWSPWAHSTVETGPFDYSDWHAQWLAVDHLARIVTPFRTTSPVIRARLYLTGQGVLRAWVNDRDVNPDRMDPTRTDFVRALYRTYDVTEFLQDGDNTIAFAAGVGEWDRTAESPRLLAELLLWHENGSITRVAPGPRSEVQNCEISVDEPFYLERHDPDAALAASELPAAPVVLHPAASPSSPATPPLNISADPTPPLHAVERFAPTEIHRSAGSRVFDVGVNIAGRSKLVMQSEIDRGTVIQVLHGEHVGTDGHIDTTNLTMPYDHGRDRQLVEYVSRGLQGELLEPWFAYFGFRYVEVRGLPDDAVVEVTAYSMHTDLASSGTVVTDSPTIDRLLATARRTLLNNVHGVPEDCPTREQAAWTGDTASVAEYELAAFDSETFINKWIADFETSQGTDGQLPAVTPDVHAHRMPSDPVWGSALHRMLLGHLMHYGDLRLVRRAIPTLRRWADFQLSCADDDGVISRSPISYGHDWLALEQTPPPIHHTAAVIDCLLALAALEESIGESDAALRRRAAAHELRAAARRAFFDPTTGTFGNGSQGSYATAIEAGILTGADARAAGERLVALIRARGNRVSSGFATTRSVVRALTALGRSQVVYDILLQPDEPGVGAMISSGPGTFWECWWIDPTNTGTGSLNHVGLGGPFAAWAWEGLAGLTPTAPGYSRFRVAPQFVRGVNRLELRAETVRGEVMIRYARSESGVRIEVDVPPGSEATLVIEGRADAVLSPGTHLVEFEIDTLHAPEPPLERVTLPSAPVAADVVGSRTLLTESKLAPGRADPALEMLPRLRCMPVPHEQPDHAVLKVVGTAHGSQNDAPTVILTPPAPLAADGITFVYALIDQCVEVPQQTAEPLLILHLSNGETRKNASTGWPAGWNRVAVDTGGLDDGVTITAIEVGLEYGDALANNALAVYPTENDSRARFHLSEVGFSTVTRTW
jgi:alpha-L-rhamnosidase